ncbi:MAG: tetratricopeptide (TPR) repeat protein [Oceanicoccus sp.]|jgi:tetratricopeptide (TPR) repeat protein
MKGKSHSDEVNIPPEELKPAISEKVLNLCKQGYALYDQGDNKIALRRFYSAWNLLPKPQTDWQEAGWVLTAIGDAYFAKGDFENGKQALLSAMHCPLASGNPIIHLRLGQCHFELAEYGAARDQFSQVISQGNLALLKKENPKYLKSMNS